MRILLVLTMAIAPGCTYQHWYTGFQENQRQECYKRPNSAEVRECLERTGMDYDQYKRARDKRLAGEEK